MKRFPKWLWLVIITVIIFIAFMVYWGYQYSTHATPQKALTVSNSTVRLFDTIPFAKGVVLLTRSGYENSYGAWYMKKGFWGWRVSRTTEAVGRLDPNNYNVDFESFAADGETFVWGTSMTRMKEIVYNLNGNTYTCGIGKYSVWHMVLPFTQAVFSHYEWTMVLPNGKSAPLFKDGNINNTLSPQTKTAGDSNLTNDSDSFDVNVSIHIKVTLDDKVKGVDPNIIRATRQALFDWDCEAAKLRHYNGYSTNHYIYIFDVIEKGNDTWEVRFREKEKESDNYNMVGYKFATVKKQASGSYEGYIVNPGGLMIKGDETY